MKKGFILAIAIAAGLVLIGCTGKKETGGQVAATEAESDEYYQAEDSRAI